MLTISIFQSNRTVVNGTVSVSFELFVFLEIVTKHTHQRRRLGKFDRLHL